MTHTSSHVIIDFVEQPVVESVPQFKRRDLICLILGFVLGALLF